MNIAQYLKYFFSFLLGSVAGWIVIFGPRAGAHLPRGRVVVTYWEKWTGNEADQMKQIVDDFNHTVGARQGIYVQYLSISNVNQKTLVSTAAGVPPDVAGLWDGQVPQFAAIDALEPLDEMAAARGITASYYKPVYWEGCRYRGRLWGLVSTPAAVALHYNKKLFRDSAAKLRAAGLNPERPPRTLAELDRYARVLDVLDAHKHIDRAGYLPMEPGWFIAHTCYWFGGALFDPATQRFTLTSPPVVRAFEWVRSYSVRLGKDSMTEFRSGLGGFNSPQNPFLTGQLAMEQQGPWMANYIEDLKPRMNRVLMSKEQEKLLSPERRRANYEWGAAPFPSAVPGLNDVTYAGFDVLVIPRGARHKREAFEFIAYVNQPGPMEKLCSLHCKNSPLRHVSASFVRSHPNPYIAVFEQLAASPHAHGLPPIPIWPEVAEELNVAAQRIYLLEMKPAEALRLSQERLQEKYDQFEAIQRARAARQ